jgi:hypothetical protein
MYALHWPSGDGGTAFCAVEGSSGLVPVGVQATSVPDSKSSVKMGTIGPGAAWRVKPAVKALKRIMLFIPVRVMVWEGRGEG